MNAFLSSEKTSKKRPMRKIKEIIIHCSDTPAGEDFCAADIDRWHRERGWSCIGYHYVVRLDGTIETGRDLSRAGAHCAGHNANSIGVCYIGGRSARGVAPVTYYDTRTEAQKKALRTLIADLRKRFGANLKVVGHHDYNKGKLCPCFDVSKEKY